VRQGAVEDFIVPYSAVYLRIQKWKNYWNRSVFAKVIHQRITAYFLTHPVFCNLTSRSRVNVPVNVVMCYHHQ